MAVTSTEEITAAFCRERFRWGDTAIVEAFLCNGSTSVAADDFDDDADPYVTIKVNCEPEELDRDVEYRWLGRWHNHPKYGRQFHASTFIQAVPHGRDGVIAYLVAAGHGLGFGKVRARVCWELFGPDAVSVFRSDPHEIGRRLAGAKRPVSEETLVVMAEKLNENAGLEACTLDLMDLLPGRGFPKTTVRESIRKYGNRAARIIRRDPYRLMEFRGCGFKRCDAMYLELGHNPARLKRQALSAWYAMASNSEGHTWFPAEYAVRALHATISGTALRDEAAFRLAVRGKALAELRTSGAQGPVSEFGGQRWFAERKKADNEADVARLAADAMQEECGWPQ